MKKLKVLAVLSLGFLSAFAQRGEVKNKGDFGQNRIHHLDSIVDLSDEQKVEIKKLQTEYKAAFKELHEQGQRQDVEKTKELRREHHKKVKAVLTPEQLTLLENEGEKKKAEMKKMHEELKLYRAENINPVIRNLREDFNTKLSEEEIAKIEETRKGAKEMRKQMKAPSGEVDSALPGKDHPKHMRRHRGHEDSEDHKALRDYLTSQLQPIIEAHQEELQGIQTDLEPLKKTWKADTENIRKKYTPKEAGNRDFKKSGMHGKRVKHADHQSDRNEQKAEMMKIRFLLMDEKSDH